MSYTMIAPIWARNYSAANIPKIGLCLHHAVALNVRTVGAVFQSESAGSTQWSIDSWNACQHVPENAYAWAAGDTWANSYLEHIEVCNEALYAPYPIAEAAIENLAYFMALRSIYRGWGYYTFTGNKYTGNLHYHQEYSATYCPGVLIPRIHEIANRANQKIKEMTMPEPQINPGSPVNDYGLLAQAHIQSKGWVGQVSDGQWAGSKSGGLRLEALKIDTTQLNLPGILRLGICVHVQSDGWIDLGEVEANTIIGTVGKAKRLEMIAPYLIENGTGKQLKYQGHIAQLGDSGIKVATNDLPLTIAFGIGTTGQARSLESFRMWLEA